MTRVLLISAEYPPMPGGIGDYTALLAAHLAASGATVAVLTTGRGTVRHDGDVTVYESIPSWDWSSIDAVHSAIRSFRPAIVHLQYQTGMYGMHPAINFLPDRLAWHTPIMRRRISGSSRLSSLLLVCHDAFALLHGWWSRLQPAIPGRQAEACSTDPCQLPCDRSLLPRKALQPHTSCGCHFVTTFHDLRHPYLFPKAGPLRAWVTRHLACASSVAIGTNGADVALLRKWRANGVLIPIGSNIPPTSARDLQAIRARYGIPAAVPLLTTFGLLNQSKGIETVIDVLAILRREGTDAHLLLIGAGAGMNDPTNRVTEVTVDRQCAAAELTAFVHRTGPLPAAAVAETLAASDVCVLPYRDGASPRRGSLLAALTQSIPVITTTPTPTVYDGLPAFRDGEVACCVPTGDARAIAGAVQAILRDDLLAARLRAGAAAYATRFTWPAIATQTRALYDTLGVAASEAITGPVAATGVER